MIQTHEDGNRYDLREHRHRFAYWAAARAAFVHSSGLTGLKGKTVSVTKDCVEKSLRAIALDEHAWPSRPGDVDDELATWTRDVLSSVSETCPKVKYGRAAKLVAVYLKEM